MTQSLYFKKLEIQFKDWTTEIMQRVKALACVQVWFLSLYMVPLSTTRMTSEHKPRSIRHMAMEVPENLKVGSGNPWQHRTLNPLSFIFRPSNRTFSLVSWKSPKCLLGILNMSWEVQKKDRDFLFNSEIPKQIPKTSTAKGASWSLIHDKALKRKLTWPCLLHELILEGTLYSQSQLPKTSSQMVTSLPTPVSPWAQVKKLLLNWSLPKCRALGKGTR